MAVGCLVSVGLRRMATPSEMHVLADAAAAGDVDAFDALVAEHHVRVYNIAYRMLSDPDDAADACQETFVKAFRALPRLRDRSQFSSWVLRIAANCSRDTLRRRRRREEVPLEESASPTVDDHLDESAGHQDSARTVQRLLMGLPEKHRIVLVLRDIEDLSYEEMAQVLSCTVSSVKNRLHRARRIFRERLEPFMSEVQ